MSEKTAEGLREAIKEAWNTPKDDAEVTADVARAIVEYLGIEEWIVPWLRDSEHGGQPEACDLADALAPLLEASKEEV